MCAYVCSTCLNNTHGWLLGSGWLYMCNIPARLSFYHCVCVCLPSYAAQRTYIFAAETEHDLKEWKAAMDNCMAKFISGGTISADSHTRLVRTGTPW